MNKTLALFCFLTAHMLIADNYPFRELSKPIFQLPQNVRIIQYSPPRTGSTLIYNILQYLFEDINTNYSCANKRVIKVHSIDKTILNNLETPLLFEFRYFFVGTIRNPLQNLASRMCITNKICSFDLINDLASDIIHDYNSYFDNFLLLKKNGFLLLRYEEIYDHFDLIFSKIEDYFNILIDEEQKKLISDYFSEKKMLDLSLQYKNFDAYDQITGIHGNHINQVRWENIIPRHYLLQTYKKLQPTMDLWGYQIEEHSLFYREDLFKED